MKTVPTFTATIYVGLKVTKNRLPQPENWDFESEVNYSHQISDVEYFCREYCDKVGLCVTVTATKFVYKNGMEDGAIVGLINYPRFPKEPHEIKEQALELAGILLEKMEQYKVTIVFPDETVMIGEDKH